MSVIFRLGFILLVAASLAACHHNVRNEDESLDTSTYRPVPTPVTEFEQKLKDVRDGHFRFVWVFKRLDGKEFTSEDTEMLRAYAPKVVDWIGLDDKKTYIAGANSQIAPDNVAALRKRYKIEDYSSK